MDSFEQGEHFAYKLQPVKVRPFAVYWGISELGVTALFQCYSIENSVFQDHKKIRKTRAAYLPLKRVRKIRIYLYFMHIHNQLALNTTYIK